MSYPIGDLVYTLPKDICDRIAALREERDRLRAALLEFGQHGPTCWASASSNSREPCDCGLAEALKGAE